MRYNGIEVKKLKVNTSKSKNAESFYIKQSYIDSNGKSTSRTIRKLGTLKELLVEHGPTRDDVMAWAKCDLIQSELYRNFLIYFLAPFIYRLLEKKLKRKYTCEELMSTLRDYEFADVQGQGFIPIYESTKLTDALHEVAGFETDYEFLTKRKMKEIQKLSKQSREKS